MKKAQAKGEMFSVKMKAYNFQPEIWDGVKPPPGAQTSQKALQKEKEIKYTLTDDP